MSTRRRALFAIALGLGLGLFGLLAREGNVVGLAIPPLLFGLALILSDAFHETPTLRVTRSIADPRIHEDEETDVHLAVANESERDAYIILRDHVPHGVVVLDGDTSLAARLAPGAVETRTYRIAAERGGHDQRRLLGSSWARWGLAVRGLDLRLESRLASLPIFETLRELEIRPRRIHAYAGSVRTHRSGSGLEILGCREYALGDDIRRVNWRASARREDLIVNLFEQERMTDVNVIVDARAHMHLQIGGAKTFDLVVRAAASVCSYFLRRGNRVGLMVYGDALNWTYPAAGRLQMERLLHSLAVAQPSTRVAFGQLRQLPTRLFATGSQLVIFSTLGSREDAEIPTQLVARGYSVLLVYPNSSKLEREAAYSQAQAKLAERLIQLEQQVSLSHLGRAGVQVIDWDITEPLSVALHHARAMLRGGLR